jgi:fused signal recognition particle receptor
MQESKNLFERLRRGLARTRRSLGTGLERLVKGENPIDPAFVEELEELLIGADLGLKITEKIIGKVEQAKKERRLKKPEEVRDLVRDSLFELVEGTEIAHPPEAPLRVILIVGVNGTGKTTCVGKLAYQYQEMGKKVMMAAADTFRAAAIEQLDVWRERAGADLVKGRPGGDPAALVFDAARAAKARGHNILLADTAGRLHTKNNLMEELKKICRVVGQEIENAPHEILLVLDATTGQNAFSQAQRFKEEVNVTGLILTKVDSTAKGGIVIRIAHELDLPVRYVGLGEAIEDLRSFDPTLFVRALLEEA